MRLSIMLLVRQRLMGGVVVLVRSALTEIGVTALDEWICRADVACVGADLRVRPQGIQRSNEDSSRFDTTDALRLDTTERPYKGLLVLSAPTSRYPPLDGSTDMIQQSG